LGHHFENKSAEYKRHAVAQVNKLFVQYFGEMEMSEIEPCHVIAWKDWRTSQYTISPKTLREDLLLLKLMFKAAIKNGYALSNPLDDVELPRNIPLKVRKAVSDEKLKQACRQLTGFELKIVLLLRNTGLRFGELYNVEVEDCDFENKTILVKSVKDATTKNYQTRETVLTPTVEKIIRALGVKSGPLLSMKRNTVEDRFNKSKKKIGFIDWDLHSLRHTFVTKLRNANIPERIVGHFVGHAQKGVTDRYTSYTKEYLEKAIEAVNFGSEFLVEPENVVTIRSPKIQENGQATDFTIEKTNKKWTEAESNRRRQPFQGCALPTELSVRSLSSAKPKFAKVRGRSLLSP